MKIPDSKQWCFFVEENKYLTLWYIPKETDLSRFSFPWFHYLIFPEWVEFAHEFLTDGSVDKFLATIHWPFFDTPGCKVVGQ